MVTTITIGASMAKKLCISAARGHISGTKGSSTVRISMAQAAKSMRLTRLLVNLVNINR